MAELKAVLFDMDGTLIETESLWGEAELDTMTHFGAADGWTASDQAHLVGGPLARMVDYMAERAGADPIEVEAYFVPAIERRLSGTGISWLPGAKELLDDVRAAGLPIGLVSNTWRTMVDHVVAALGVRFDVVVAGDEVARTKPAPDPYLEACARLGVLPAETCVVEDSPTGMQSALEAGCTVLGVPTFGEVPDHPRLVVAASLVGVAMEDLRRITVQAG